MTITTPDLGLEIIEALDFEYTPPCESINHGNEPQAHGGAAYALIRSRCPGCGNSYTGYRCKPFVSWALLGRLVRCNANGRGCQQRFPGYEFVTILAYVGDA